MILLVNANVYDFQRISILLSAATSTTGLTEDSTNEPYMESLSYAKVSVILRHCDNVSNNSLHTIGSNSAAGRSQRSFPGNLQNMFNLIHLKELKMRSKCRKCNIYGHWSSDHIQEGSVPPGIESFAEMPR